MPDFMYPLLSALIAFGAWKMGSLTLGGAVAAFAAAAVMGLASPQAFLLLMFFFFTSVPLSRFRRSRKAQAESLHKKHGPRDLAQVLANSLAALVMLLIAGITSDPSWELASLVAIGACTADTWASELGQLSHETPRNILTFKPMAAGLSGGVSIAGTAASLAASAIILLPVYLSTPSLPWHALFLIACFSFSGSILDSVLGSLLQGKYLAPEGHLTEVSGTGFPLVRGFAFIDNDVVNFLASLLAASASGIFL